MTVNTSDKESLGKGQLGKKLLVKDRILSKITFTTSSNHQRPTDQTRNGDILMVQQQSELIMVKEPDKPFSGKLVLIKLEFCIIKIISGNDPGRIIPISSYYLQFGFPICKS